MRRQQGMTLVEVVIAIVVIGICVVSALGLLSSLSVRSASAMTRTQATAIAASYLENVLSLPYATVTTYAADDSGARDSSGSAIAGLGSYRVQVNTFADSLGSAPNAVNARRIEVTVTDPTGVSTRLTGYRTSFTTNQVMY